MGRSFFRRFSKNVFLTITILLCIIFICASLNPYLNPKQWWFIGFLGLIVPYLIMALIFAIIFWLLLKPKFAIIPFAALLVGFNQIKVVFAANFKAKEIENKNYDHLRLISWNVGSMYGLSKDANVKNYDRNEIAEAIIKLEPDVVCLQEFNHSYTKGGDADNIGLFSASFPHYFYALDYYKPSGVYSSGSIIFSRLPIINSGKVRYPGNFNESLIYVDIVRGADTIRIFTTHLQSFAFSSTDYANMDHLTDNEEKAVSASRNIFYKMKNAFTSRGEQADVVKNELDKNSLPSIICGDFNDVPNSYTYHHIKDDRQDAFLEKGFGIGKTYIALAPTLRIDYILPDKSFTVKRFEMIDENLSDHLMLVTDLKLKK